MRFELGRLSARALARGRVNDLSAGRAPNATLALLCGTEDWMRDDLSVGGAAGHSYGQQCSRISFDQFRGSSREQRRRDVSEVQYPPRFTIASERCKAGRGERWVKRRAGLIGAPVCPATRRSTSGWSVALWVE